MRKTTDLKKGRWLHSCIIKSGYILNAMVANTLLSMYAKCGAIGDETRLFVELESKILYRMVL